MRAISISSHGGPEVLQMAEVARPRVGDGDLLVQVHYAGVNFIDVYQRSGSYQVGLPYVPGMEGAGVVVELGAAVTEFQVGDRVAWGFASGSYAEFVALPAVQAVKVPAATDLSDAAAAMLQGMTAHYLLNSTYQLQSGETCLIHAAAGGVGQLLVQMAKAKGAQVIATAGSAAKRELAASLGADHVFPYEGFASAVRNVSVDGVHVVYDGVGADTFDGSLAALRTRGLLALFGAASGPVPAFDLQRLNSGGSLFITRPSLAHYVLDRNEMVWRATEVLDAIAAGTLRVQIHEIYALANAPLAHMALESRATTGKLLLKVA